MACDCNELAGMSLEIKLPTDFYFIKNWGGLILYFWDTSWNNQKLSQALCSGFTNYSDQVL